MYRMQLRLQFNVLVELLTTLLRNQDVLGLNIGPNTGYFGFEAFYGFL